MVARARAETSALDHNYLANMRLFRQIKATQTALRDYGQGQLSAGQMEFRLTAIWEKPVQWTDDGEGPQRPGIGFLWGLAGWGLALLGFASLVLPQIVTHWPR